MEQHEEFAAKHPRLAAVLDGPNGEELAQGMLLDFCDTLFRVSGEAKEKHDGHLTIMRFTTHWKAFYGTPTFDYPIGREEVWRLPAYPNMQAALSAVLAGESELPFLDSIR